MIMVGSIRYRLPLEPFLIVFAAAAFMRLIGRFDRSRNGRPLLDKGAKSENTLNFLS